MIPRIEFEPDASAPLDGIRVVDLSRLVAGNMVSLQLADQGAEVIKIEDPRTGDPLRAWRVKGLSLHWKVYARNKKSLALNLRPQAGRDALCDLLAQSHVLIENYRPGTLEEMGLGPDVLHARNPGLIIVRITGFGQDGPYRDRPGFGTLVEAMSGFASKNGFGDRAAGAAAAGVGRHGGGAVRRLCGDGRAARGRARRQGAGDRSAAAGSDHFHPGSRCGDPSRVGREAAAHRQPLADHVAAQCLCDEGWAVHRDLGVDPGDGGAACSARSAGRR